MALNVNTVARQINAVAAAATTVVTLIIKTDRPSHTSHTYSLFVCRYAGDTDTVADADTDTAAIRAGCFIAAVACSWIFSQVSHKKYALYTFIKH